jgi:TIR domain
VSAGPREPGSVPGPKVFITYRREETAAHAGRLYDAMEARFGKGNVFMDVDMEPGVDFIKRITEAVGACQVLIVVMGPTWATVEDEVGKARIADPEDFVRLEVETALRRPDVTPIPVLVSGARMPNREDLPPEVQAITRRNALELSDQRWRNDIGRLISTLEKLLAEIALVPGPSSPERGAASEKPAPADAAQAPAQTAPPSPVAASTSVENHRLRRLAGGARRLRWVLLGAIAIAAVVVVVVVELVGRGGSPTPTGHFNGAKLSDLVLKEPPGPPGNLLIDPKSGNGYPDQLHLPTPQGAYHNEFTQNGDTPYRYSTATAAVFKDETAARKALARLINEKQGGFKSTQVQGLGEDGWVFQNTDPTEPEYLYAWRTDRLLQVFDLVWSQGPPSKDTARGFADKMDRLIDQ